MSQCVGQAYYARVVSFFVQFFKRHRVALGAALRAIVRGDALVDKAVLQINVFLYRHPNIWNKNNTQSEIQLDCQSATRTRKNNLPANRKGYDTFETTVGKLSTRRIQIFRVYFCLGIILKVILNNFQNNA